MSAARAAVEGAILAEPAGAVRTHAASNPKPEPASASASLALVAQAGVVGATGVGAEAIRAEAIRAEAVRVAASPARAPSLEVAPAADARRGEPAGAPASANTNARPDGAPPHDAGSLVSQDVVWPSAGPLAAAVAGAEGSGSAPMAVSAPTTDAPAALSSAVAAAPRAHGTREPAIALGTADGRAGSSIASDLQAVGRAPTAEAAGQTTVASTGASGAVWAATSVELGSFVVDGDVIGPPVEPSAVPAMVDGLARAGGAHRVVVVLSPPELGRLRIVVSEAPGGTAVQLQVERPATQALIEHALGGYADTSGSGSRGGQPHAEDAAPPSRVAVSVTTKATSVRARRGVRVDTWI